METDWKVRATKLPRLNNGVALQHEHGVGRAKAAACAGTSQTYLSRVTPCLVDFSFDWRSPSRYSQSLLGPAYKTLSMFSVNTHHRPTNRGKPRPNPDGV